MSGQERPGTASGALCHPDLARAGQRLGELARIGAAGHGHVGLLLPPLPPTATDEVDQLAGLTPTTLSAGHAGGQSP